MLKESLYACNNEGSRTIVARLVAHVDLLTAIVTLCKKYNFKAAAITVCFGSLASAGYEVIAKDENDPLGARLGAPLHMDGPLQLLSAQGTVSYEEKSGELVAHLHGAFIDKDAVVHGGHFLVEKCPVLRTMEIVIQEIVGIAITRRYNPVTNSIQLTIE
jgi:predicted DNA-binding protein with PD1-like motif